MNKLHNIQGLIKMHQNLEKNIEIINCYRQKQICIFKTIC